LIDWCVNSGSPDATSWYPGDDVVDIVGMDLYDLGQYDSDWSSDPNAPLAEQSGLNWLDSFSAQHNKLISFPEWGTTFDTSGDFISQLAAWMNARGSRISYMNWWDDTDASSQLEGGASPVDLQAWIANWSGTTYSGAWNKGH
jgi:beta-mannanase